MLTYIEADITEVCSGLIIHGCNTLGYMGAGVALAIRNKWPNVYKQYKMLCEHYQPVLGEVQTLMITSELYVANIFTQQTIGRTGIHANLNAIEVGLNKIIGVALELNISEIHSPKIGCNLGGLKWMDVEKIYLKVFENIEQKCNIYYKG